MVKRIERLTETLCLLFHLLEMLVGAIHLGIEQSWIGFRVETWAHEVTPLERMSCAMSAARGAAFPEPGWPKSSPCSMSVLSGKKIGLPSAWFISTWALKMAGS